MRIDMSTGVKGGTSDTTAVNVASPGGTAVPVAAEMAGMATRYASTQAMTRSIVTGSIALLTSSTRETSDDVAAIMRA